MKREGFCRALRDSLSSFFDRQGMVDEAKLLPFQREGVAAGLALNGRLLLGDEMGLGKTVQAIALACHYRAEWPLLIFAPTSMCLPWCEELERWCTFLRPGDINLVRSHHNGALRLAPVTIVSYGLITNGKEKEQLAAALAAANFRVAIADEAHYLKSKDSQRAQLVLPLLAAARRIMLLTGTPALNRPVELYTLCHTLCPRVPQFATYKAFTERFCGAHLRFVGRVRHLDVSGCTNAPELHELLRTHAMIRRLKSEVLTQLPPKRRQRILLTLSGGAGRGASSAATSELAQLDRAMSETRDERGKQHLLSQMCVALGSAKAHAAAELVLEMLPSCRDGRLLFFAHHKAMLDAVDAAAATARVRTFRIDGSVPAVERAGLVNAFQALPADTPAIFLLSILAAGQGLTLTGASTAVFGELRWTPGELLQAEDRCHRIGQRSSVNVYYLVAKDTADEAMWAVLQRKVRALGAALDGQARQRLHVEGEERRIEGASQEDCADEAGEAGRGGDGGDGSSIGGEALSLLSRKAERERQMKRERSRLAFNSLFAAKASPKPAATATAASSSATPIAHTMTPSTTIDLTREFDEAAGDATASAPAAAAPASKILGGPSDATATSAARSSAAGATSAGTDLVEGWFAVSALTGRVHAFGGDDAPLPAGMGASALPHEVLDDDPSSLPLPLQEPSMLAAARRWVLDWEGLTPAQKAVLHDRPVRVPLARATLGPALRPPPMLPSGMAAAAAAGSSVGASSLVAAATTAGSFPRAAAASSPTAAAGAAAGTADAPTLAPAPPVPAVAAGGSRMRETTSERWAASHVPLSEHVTLTWRTESTATARTWTQHFSVEHALPYCLYCLTLHQPARESPFCSDRCAAQFSSAESQASARRQLFERELGVCQLCGYDAHAFYRRLVALQSEQERLQCVMGSPYSTASDRLRRMLTAPKEGDFWEADHIVPVAEGGGETSLDNFQTLCVPCHQKKTRQQAADKHKRSLAEAAEGTADLREWFARPREDGAVGISERESNDVLL